MKREAALRPVQVLERRLREEMDRGRGGAVIHPFPVALEPQFVPFRHNQHPARIQLPGGNTGPVRVEPAGAVTMRFLKVRPSPLDSYDRSLTEQFLLSLNSHQPVAFEIIGRGGAVSVQYVSVAQAAPSLVSQLRSHYPQTQEVEGIDSLSQPPPEQLLACGYRLRDSHLFQIRVEARLEPLLPLLGVLANLKEGEVALYQVLFQPTRAPWPDNLLRLVSDPWEPGRSIFLDLPDLPRKARAKTERPLFAVAVRLAASSPALLDRLQGVLLPQLESGENGLVPIGERYPVDAVLGRFTRSEGLLLALSELAVLAHLPNPSLVAEGLERAEKGAPAPHLSVEHILCPLGSNDYRGVERSVGIAADQLTRHLAILGGTGSGKTNLMKVAFAPLLDQGYGLAILDPKGDLAQGFLDLIPQHRVDDVVWFDPTDRNHPPALNVLKASGDLSVEVLTGELMIGLKRIFTGASEFGPRMEWILRTAVRTLLDSEGEKTLYDVRRFLEEAQFRSRVLESVKDPRLRRFWQGRNLSHNIIDPLLNRLSTFLDRPSIRDVVCQPNRVDFHQIMREGKIFIANLEKGRLQDSAYVLGSFILSRLQLAALGRPTAERTLFPVLVDEFHVYAGHSMDTESIETFLSETRSYLAPLVVSTQYLGRLNRGVVAALFGNLGTQVCLNMGQIDAQLLQRELGKFTAEDLLDLGIGQAIVRMGPARDTFNVKVPLARAGNSHRDEIIEKSRQRYCRTAEEVSDLLGDDDAEVQQDEVWIADGKGNVFRQEQYRQYQSQQPREEPPTTHHSTNEQEVPPIAEDRGQARKEGEQTSGRTAEAGVDRELITYLEHAANHPFVSALERDKSLGLSRYKGDALRKRLLNSGWIRLHKGSTGRRSGQLALLEVTEEGYELLSSLKIRANRPRGRGGFLHRYYAFKLKQYAEHNWPGCVAAIEDSSQGRPADVTVQLAGQPAPTIAFEIFVTGEDKEIRGILRDVELFEQVFVCALTPGALESLETRARETLGDSALKKVRFELISGYLQPETTATSEATVESQQPTRPWRPRRTRTKSDQHLKPESDIEKSATKSETEIENKSPSRRRQGRRPKTPLMDQVAEAYLHIHDWDWLRDSDLAKLPEAQERLNPRQVMPEAQALRGLLFEAARQVIQDLATVPDKAGVRVFLEGHLAGKNLTAIARELGVSREWVGRGYRKEAFRLAGMQFVRNVSSGP